MKVCTLALLVRNDSILLAMKKRGFGQGFWNGAGGKVEADETIEQAMIRECQEEIGVTPTKFEKVAVHDFVFADCTKDIEGHVYLVTEWEGQPQESDEMAPRWFDLQAIPYDSMWADDHYWLPQVLQGQKLHTRFTFDAAEQLVDSKVHEAAL